MAGFRKLGKKTKKGTEREVNGFVTAVCLTWLAVLRRAVLTMYFKVPVLQVNLLHLICVFSVVIQLSFILVSDLILST